MKTIMYVMALQIIIFLLYANHSVNGQPVKTSVDTLATINSFEAVGNFYKMEYTGDYGELLDWLDDMMTSGDGSVIDGFQCSLFSANGDPDNQIFGRNFDNPQNDVLIARYRPPEGYSSLAFTRMSDLGFAYGTNYSNLSFQQKLPLLHAAYFVPDGINENGLAAGLASVDPVNYVIDPEKDTIFVTRLIREILDHAETVEDAILIANSYNVFDNSVNIISHHVLVGCVSGESVVLEFSDGEFQAVTNDSAWQVLTNIPVYNVPNQQLMNSCWRYSSLYNRLEENGGVLSWSEGMDALETVHINCPWSAIYDLNNRGIYITVHNNYEDIAFTDLQDFEFIIYVGTDSPVDPVYLSGLRQNYPNPFRHKTTIGFNIQNSGHVELYIHDWMGRRIKTFMNGNLDAGNYSVTWDSMNDNGAPVAPGIYWCTLNSHGEKEIIKMIRIGPN